MDYDRFTREQVILLTYTSGCGTMAYTFTWVAYLSERSGWVVLFVGIPIVIPFAMGILYLCRNHNGCTIFDIIEKGFGKYVYILIVSIYSLIVIVSAIAMLNMFTGVVKIYFLQFTPVWLIMSFIVLIAILFVNKRTLLFGRVIELLTVWYTLNFFTGFSLAFAREFKFENITPIFDVTLAKFGIGVFFSLGAVSEILLLIMVMAKDIGEPFKHRRWVVKGVMIWAFILSLAQFIMQGMTGYELLSRNYTAGIGISRIIYIGDFVRGLEIFILATYDLIAIVKISVSLYEIWIPIKKLFNEKYSTILLYLIGVLILLPSIWFNSASNAFFLSIFMSFLIFLPFSIIVMLIGCLSLFIIRKRCRGGAS